MKCVHSDVIDAHFFTTFYSFSALQLVQYCPFSLMKNYIACTIGESGSVSGSPLLVILRSSGLGGCLVNVHYSIKGMSTIYCTLFISSIMLLVIKREGVSAGESVLCVKGISLFTETISSIRTLMCSFSHHGQAITFRLGIVGWVISSTTLLK